jgi:hypothetical protein
MSDIDKRGEAMVKAARTFYRNNFTAGESDEAFVIWIEGILGMDEPWPSDSEGEVRA